MEMKNPHNSEIGNAMRLCDKNKRVKEIKSWNPQGASLTCSCLFFCSRQQWCSGKTKPLNELDSDVKAMSI